MRSVQGREESRRRQGCARCAHRISSPPRLQPHLLGLVAQMCCFQYDEKENKLADGTQPCRSSDDGLACCIGVCGFAACGVVWIACCFFCGDAAPGVKKECQPCGGTGFVVRNEGKFVPSNEGMERDAADAAPASAGERDAADAAPASAVLSTYGTPYQRHGRPYVNPAQLPPGSTLTDTMN